jgi:hypothetical protein
MLIDIYIFQQKLFLEKWNKVLIKHLKNTKPKKKVNI